MRTTYLVLLSSKLDREKVLKFLDSLPNTGGWFYSTPNSFFIKSSFSANELSNKILEHFGKARHFVVEVGENRQGMIPKDHWELF